jgi:hypothetical protein
VKVHPSPHPRPSALLSLSFSIFTQAEAAARTLPFLSIVKLVYDFKPFYTQSGGG